jgi:hypothetical protein
VRLVSPVSSRFARILAHAESFQSEEVLQTTSSHVPKRTSFASSRALSGVEFLLGAAIVIGHNVFRIVPNEVPILAALAMLSMRLRNGAWAWSSLGFRRPTLRIFVIAVAAALLRILLGTYVIDPVTSHFWPPAIAPAAVHEIAGNIRAALLYLPVVWLFAAFGEEIAYRGYLLNRAADCGGRSNASLVGRCASRIRAVRLRALLQRSRRNRGLRCGRVDSRRGLSAIRPESVDNDSGARSDRYGQPAHSLSGLGQLRPFIARFIPPYPSGFSGRCASGPIASTGWGGPVQ